MKYKVKVTFTVWDVYEVEADSVSDAYEKAEDMAGDKSLNEMNNEFEGCTILDSDPDDELDYSPTMRKAVRYAMEQMEPEDVAVIAAKVSKNYSQHMNPAYGIDEGKVIDLLEEYGEDNDLPEGWWEEECDMDDIVLLIAHWG